MAKLDLCNCFRSLRLPRSRVGELSVCVGDAQYVWQSLPFGWKYSPLLCQKLVYNVVRTSVWWLPVLFFAYVDDILIVGTRHFVRKAVRRAKHRLQRVGFVISPKSVTEPSRDVDLVGKVFDLRSGTLENRPGMLRGLVRLWLLSLLGLLNRKGMERLLGRLEWALRPSAGLSPLLAVAYYWKHARGSRIPRALMRPLLTTICFAFVPQRYMVKARVQVEPPICWSGHVLFADAAPLGTDTFFVGLYLPSGGMRVFQCPRWVSTLQAAELWGWMQGVCLAAYMKWPRVCVGSDSTVARCQIQGQRGAIFCCGQQRILRALFWLRRWSRMPIAGFFVPSERNPADLPSRVHEFDSERSCLGLPNRGTGNGTRPPFPTRISLHWPISHGSVRHVTA